MEYAPKVMFHVFGFPITETVTTTWIIMAVIIFIAWLGGRKLEKVPGKFQNIMELVVDGVNSLTKSTMGEDKLSFAPYMGALAFYLAFANLIGLIGLRPPTADLTTTFALSLLTFFMTQYFGLRSKGLGYIKGFAQPFILLLPINIIGEIANPISLAFRLFGNIVGGLIIMSLVYSVVPLILPVLPHAYFDVFSGLLQTFIFVMLSMVYISGAMED
ncbi:F0F1 ATP synthase subunit A [Garciella nitratireducens]|uniref:ATP synthase subunit a n=1 Tax=Garciella nitratireducens DSM 15102 TaxID=1121911 RepID=A0A1T4MK60_9FIRM|nr:F0F1 ATP synthase subunit A [Garciella nitratireducens]RBP37804.1 ATP synthase F0 subcomplex A subunit [Garciella nitratireducens]SJZ67247.1 ATP synthase F0 subcomplex A subunit [Garciella nitratireducens DSM 15102]